MSNFTDNIKIYFTKSYLRKYIIYLIAVTLLSLGVSLIYQTFFGNAAWDAFQFNIIEMLDVPELYVYTPISAILVIIAYLIEWKRPNIAMIVPVVLTFIFSLGVGLFNDILPNVADISIIWNVIYFIVALTIISIALNLIVYCKFSLPAIDQLCMSIAKRLKITFGQSKIIGELIAVVLAVISGLIYGNHADNFNMGFSTIFFIAFIGFFVDLLRNPIFRILKAIPKLELFSDGMLEEDINQDNYRRTARGIVIKEDKILVIFMKKLDFYILPGGGVEKNESLKACCRREVLEETGYKIKLNEEKVVVTEYFLDATYENHYFIAKLRFKKPFPEKISLTEEEKKSGMELIWMDKDELMDVLNNYDSTHEHGQHVMWREFLGIINSI